MSAAKSYALSICSTNQASKGRYADRARPAEKSCLLTAAAGHVKGGERCRSLTSKTSSKASSR